MFDFIITDAEDEPEPEPEEEEVVDEKGKPVLDADGNAVMRKKVLPPKEPKQVFVENSLIGPNHDRLHFFKQPRTGCYFAMRLTYPSLLNDETLDEAGIVFVLFITPD